MLIIIILSNNVKYCSVRETFYYYYLGNCSVNIKIRYVYT